MKNYYIYEDMKKGWIFAEGIMPKIGQIRILIFLVSFIILDILLFYSIFDESSNGYVEFFILSLIITVGLAIFLYYHQKQLKKIAEEREKLEEEKRKNIIKK